MSLNDKDFIEEIAQDVKEKPDTSIRLIKRFLPLGIMLLLDSLLWLYFVKTDHTNHPRTNSSVDTTIQTSIEAPLDAEGQAAASLWSQTLGGNVELSLPNSTKLSVPENGFEKQLLGFLNEGCPGDVKATWFNCDRLLFKTGSTELNSVSMDQIADLANLMKAFPSSTFKIGGYTDNTGDAAVNKKISGERAVQVMNALLAQGIAATSLSAEGYGPEHPVCPANDTDECKAKNRRVAIRVDKCK